LDRQKLAFVRDKNKKTRQTPQAAAGLFLWAVMPKGSSRVKRGLILSFLFAPNPLYDNNKRIFI
jgi:hypothetical protein